LAEAVRIYDLLLFDNPLHADALHLRGVAAHQLGDHPMAVELIQKAIVLKPNDPAQHLNLAEALRCLGRLDEAEAQCRRALMIYPNYPEAHHNLGVVLARQNRQEEAEVSFREGLRHRPDFARSVVALADTLREQRRIEEAMAEYRRALALDPGSMAAHANYGLLLAQRGQIERGLEHCRKAVHLQPGDAIAQHNLGRLLLEFGRVKEAMVALTKALAIDNQSPLICLSLGEAWFELGNYQEAHIWFERTLALDPKRIEARCHQGAMLLEVGNYMEALKVFEDVLAADPVQVLAHNGKAKALFELGDVEGATASQREALRIFPEAPGLHAALGYTLSTAGDIPNAVEQFNKALGLNPHCISALAGLATTQGRDTGDDIITRGEELLAAPWMTDERRSSLRFGLAHVCDGRGEYPRAAEHMISANQLQKKYWEERGQGYSAAAHRRYVDRLIAGFTPEYFQRLAGFGRNTERPVFVLGMPRSGTTLTEQILASHPAAHGAGERRFIDLGFSVLPQALGLKIPRAECLSQVTPEAVQRIADWHLEQLQLLDGGKAARIIDKMPDNYQLIGWILTLFPQAKIIWCNRDVRDVALSCWITNFARIRWANDLEDLAERINDYQRLMTHYRKVLPVRIFTLDYAQLVSDQEGTSRRLLEFVGLEWDPACLTFHQTQRLVRTASATQVRKPMYKHAVARWRHYEAMLQPLLDRLDAPVSV
jgi:tetratricopeptide (TPR) repeat protein